MAETIFEPEIMITEVYIKQEPELIIENEFETEKICKYLNKDDITQEDRLNLIWHNCVICEERFLSIEDLSSHISKHSEFCDIDKKLTSKVSNIKSSQCLPSTSKQDLVTNRNSLKIRLKIERGDIFKCDQCNLSYVRRSYFRRHIRTHIGDKLFFKCEQCHLSFSRRDSLHSHMKAHIEQKRIEQKCLEEERIEQKPLKFDSSFRFSYHKTFHCKCSVTGCSVNQFSPNVTFYRFPKDKNLFEKWCQNLQLNPEYCKKTTVRVCSQHFEKQFIGRRKLIGGALPTLFLGHEEYEKIFLNSNLEKKKYRKCCVENCKSAGNGRFFAFPKDAELKRKWLSICHLEENCRTTNMFICVKHFKTKYIGKTKLLTGACPSIDVSK